MLSIPGICIAQNNGLTRLRNRSGSAIQHPPLTTQPVFRHTLRPVGDVRGTTSPVKRETQPAVNPVLKSASLIAVELPEPEKLQVHDLVTIVVREDKRFQTDSKLKSEKDWTIDAELSKWFRLDTRDHLVGQAFADPTPGIGFDLQNDYEGKGKVDRQDVLTLRIQAEVIDVKPNGNLVLEARKRITVDEDDQIATLTGVCRGEDITAQNTVLSTQVADLVVDVRHTGAARDAARRGWLMRGFDLLRPF
jgi:flagellar L-ring protein precursor FlgH